MGHFKMMTRFFYGKFENDDSCFSCNLCCVGSLQQVIRPLIHRKPFDNIYEQSHYSLSCLQKLFYKFLQIHLRISLKLSRFSIETDKFLKLYTVVVHLTKQFVPCNLNFECQRGQYFRVTGNKVSTEIDKILK